MIEDMKKYLFGVGDFFSETWNLLMINFINFLLLGIISIVIRFVIGILSLPLIAIFIGILVLDKIGIISIISIILLIGIGFLLSMFGSAYIDIGTQYITMNHIAKRKININMRSVFRFVLSRYFKYLGVMLINVVVTVIIVVVVLFIGFTFGLVGVGLFESVEYATIFLAVIFLIASLLCRLLIVKLSFTTHSLIFFDTGILESYKTSLRTSKGYLIQILKHVIIFITISTFINILSGSENFLFKVIISVLMSFVSIFSAIYMSLVFLNLYYYGETPESDYVNNYHDSEDDFRNEVQFGNIDEDLSSTYREEKYDEAVPFDLSKPKDYPEDLSRPGKDPEDLYKFDTYKEEDSFYRKDEDIFDEDDFL